MKHLVSFPKLGWEFTVNEDVISFGNFTMKWYGLLIAIGFLLAVLYAYTQIKKMNIDGDKLVDVIIVGLICAIIGARLYFVIFYPGDKYWKDPVQIVKIWEGGLGFYGGFIGALLGGAIMCKIRKMSVPALFDIVSVCFMIGQAIGRWGNFTNQEAFGAPTDLPWGMVSANTGGIAVHPCFFYEFLLCTSGFIFLHFFNSKLRRYDGQTFLMYLVWYGTGRFFIEPLRTDSLYIGGMKVSVLLSALMVIGAILVMIILRKRTVLTGCGNKKVMEANGIFYDEKGYAKMPESNEIKIEENDEYTSILSPEVKLEDADKDLSKAKDSEQDKKEE